MSKNNFIVSRKVKYIMVKKVIGFLMDNPITQTCLTLIVYCFYTAVIGISLIPSVIIMIYASKIFLNPSLINSLDFIVIKNIAIFSISIGLAMYAYFITGLIFMGMVQKILTWGFKPGKYPVNSFIFVRWLIYSGLHIIVLNTILPLMSVSYFARIYYMILGCKLGKNVNINTPGLHDAYLLQLGNNIVIGGKADISCHIFEGNHLILGRIKIGDNVLIGTECYIMPGVTIGNNCNIGMYSYIRKNKTIPDNSVIMALPGLPVRKIAEIEKGFTKK